MTKAIKETPTSPAKRPSPTHCGKIGIVGRTNVGKSTLLNGILQRKVCITSSKPQTTRNNILGIKTHAHCQSIYIDTPGLHRKTKRRLNQRMNRQAYRTIDDVDTLLLVIEALKWNQEDEWILARAQSTQKPTVLVVNKVDTVKQKTHLLPFLDKMKHKHAFSALVPICARRMKSINTLETIIESLLPLGEHYFSQTEFTDCSDPFLAAEIIREKLMRQLHHELPYAIFVEVESFCLEEDILKISALIWVETLGQKKIVIGKKGEQLKQIGQLARKAIEKLLGHQVHLTLWVKVKKGWPDNEALLGLKGL